INEKLVGANENINLKRKFSDFYICIGNFYPHKNIERLIRAYAKVKSKNKLVLAGPDDFFANKIDKLIVELHQSNRIIMYKNPDKTDLVFFYKNAKALIN